MVVDRSVVSLVAKFSAFLWEDEKMIVMTIGRWR